MSYAMVVYSIPLAQMGELLGSGDRDVLAEIQDEDDYFLEQTDHIFEDRFDEGEEPLTAVEAIEHLLDGGPYRDGFDSLYLYAFEALCRAIGSAPSNRAFQPPIRWGYIERVDRYLKSIRFPYRTSDLAGNGLRFKIPYADCIPSIGHWPRKHYQKAMTQLLKHRLDGEDVDIAEALASIIGWLDEALKQEDDILVGIYS
jgi:hypothetical protein